MKAKSTVWLGLLILSVHFPLRGQAPELIHVNFAETAIIQVLEIYTAASGLELITSSQVNNLTAKVTIQPTNKVERSEMLRLIEKALLEQAGVVITKIDDKRASVTYNDALPTKRVIDVKPIPEGKLERQNLPTLPRLPLPIQK